jgi:hypothetical protein
METAVTVTPQQEAAIRRLIIHGDLSKLTTEQQENYYEMLCDACGLDWRFRPFDYLKLNGKLVLYANKNCGEQLRQNKKISISLPEKKIEEGVYIVTARAESGGRHDEATGAVSIEHLKGEQRANAIMKAETKAKRRVTLSFAGLGMLDETEVESIQGAEKIIGASSTEPTHADTLTGKPENKAAQAEFERKKIADIEKEKIAKNKKRWDSLPKEIRDGFGWTKDSVDKIISVLDENHDDPELIKAYLTSKGWRGTADLSEVAAQGMAAAG